MSERQEFIAHIAQKLGRPTPSTMEPLVLNFPLFRLNSQEERIDKFIKIFEGLGGKATTASTAGEAAQALKNWFGETPSWLNNTAIVTWGELPTMARACLEELGWPARTYGEIPAEERKAFLDRTELGITGADYAIAQSGSLVLKSSPKRGRGVSLAPIRHLTFVSASVMRDSLDQVMDELMQEEVPAAIEIITGPSRTSDIEMDLSIGVHGPVEVYAIVMVDQ